MDLNTKNTTSDKKFGLFFTALFFIVFLFDLTFNNHFNTVLFVIGILLLLISLVTPKLLNPFNLLWFNFGLVLHKIISPVILAFMFFCIFTPMGIVLRLLGKKILPLQFEADFSSYWIKRERNNSEQTNFNDQF